ncbi:MAG: response regulator [Bryobacterales bacterium]|nr:response regulator [Bryobacterales bacterium]
MPHARPKLLIVDDDADFRESLAAFLQAHGYEVVHAANSEQGLLRARLEKPALIIMDLMMNERTEGCFAIQQIRSSPELRDVPVFVASALYQRAPDFGIPPERSWLGHDEFFAKPVDLPRLLEAIRRRLGGQPTPTGEAQP